MTVQTPKSHSLQSKTVSVIAMSAAAAALLATGAISPKAHAGGNDMAQVPQLTQAYVTKPRLNLPSNIGLARIDNGRVIGAPFNELQDWAGLSQRMDKGFGKFGVISPTGINRVTAAYNKGGRESSNKLDEVRIVAADHDMPYVLIYGTDKDAEWGSFGGMALRDTGFVVPAGHQLSPKGKVKALLVNTFSGKVLGTMTSNKTDKGLYDLTQRVEDLLIDLSGNLEPRINA